MESETFPVPQPQIASRTRVIEPAVTVFCVASETFPLPQPKFAARTRVIGPAPTAFCVASPFFFQTA